MNSLRLTIVSLLLSMIICQLSAQGTLNPISSFQSSYELIITPDGQIAKIAADPKDNAPIKIRSITLEDGDLKIDLQLKENRSDVESEYEIENIYLKPVPETTDPKAFSEGLNSGNRWLLGDLTIGNADDPESASIVWMNLQEQFRYPLTGVFKLQIQVVGKGVLPIDFQKNYEFNLEKQLPNLGLATIGTGFIVWGLSQKTKANNFYYNQYLQRTVNDDDTKRLLELSNSRRHEYLIMTYGGIVILAADLAWYLYRKNKLSKNRRLKDKYRDYQDPTLFIKPRAGFENGNTQLGLSLTINLNK